MADLCARLERMATECRDADDGTLVPDRPSGFVHDDLMEAARLLRLRRNTDVENLRKAAHKLLDSIGRTKVVPGKEFAGLADAESDLRIALGAFDSRLPTAGSEGG